MARGAVFQEVRPGAGFKTGDFVKRKVGGATVVRLGGYEPIARLTPGLTDKTTILVGGFFLAQRSEPFRWGFRIEKIKAARKPKNAKE